MTDYNEELSAHELFTEQSEPIIKAVETLLPNCSDEHLENNLIRSEETLQAIIISSEVSEKGIALLRSIADDTMTAELETLERGMALNKKQIGIVTDYLNAVKAEIRRRRVANEE